MVENLSPSQKEPAKSQMEASRSHTDCPRRDLPARFMWDIRLLDPLIPGHLRFASETAFTKNLQHLLT